jgi:hypothetical protein
MNGLNQYPGPTTVMAGQAARDPGVLARVDGINASLHDLHEKLSSFGSKLAGEAQKDGAAGRPMSQGIAGTLSAAETWLRQCHQIVDALHQAF